MNFTRVTSLDLEAKKVDLIRTFGFSTDSVALRLIQLFHISLAVSPHVTYLKSHVTIIVMFL